MGDQPLSRFLFLESFQILVARFWPGKFVRHKQIWEILIFTILVNISSYFPFCPYYFLFYNFNNYNNFNNFNNIVKTVKIVKIVKIIFFQFIHKNIFYSKNILSKLLKLLKLLKWYKEIMGHFFKLGFPDVRT